MHTVLQSVFFLKFDVGLLKLDNTPSTAQYATNLNIAVFILLPAWKRKSPSFLHRCFPWHGTGRDNDQYVTWPPHKGIFYVIEYYLSHDCNLIDCKKSWVKLVMRKKVNEHKFGASLSHIAGVLRAFVLVRVRLRSFWMHKSCKP